jgi:protein TonB
MSALPSAESRLRHATVLPVIVAMHLLLAMLLADAFTRHPLRQTDAAIEVSLVGESRPPSPPPDVPSPRLQQLAQVQVIVPEFMPDLPVEAPPISAAVVESARSSVEPPAAPVNTGIREPVFDGIQLLSSLAISAYYPPLSLKLKEEGTVTNSFCVDADGKVVSVELTRSSGHKRLDEAARRLTRDSRWQAGTLDGRPVASCALHTLRFFLAR